MAAPPSDPAYQTQNKKKGPPFIMLVPLIYAPILPLIRISLRHKPVLRDRLFYAALAGAFAHGCYLVILGEYLISDICYLFLVIKWSIMLSPKTEIKAKILVVKLLAYIINDSTVFFLMDMFRTDLYDVESK